MKKIALLLIVMAITAAGFAAGRFTAPAPRFDAQAVDASNPLDAALSLVREKLERNEPEQALILLELFEGFETEPQLMVLLTELRVGVLSQLRERAAVTGNDYELYWLGSELEKAGSALP